MCQNTCPCCDQPTQDAVQETKRGLLHMATCLNFECDLMGYTLTVEGYPTLQWERYIKDAERCAEVKAKVCAVRA